jgi:hypothetical protein
MSPVPHGRAALIRAAAVISMNQFHAMLVLRGIVTTVHTMLST